MLRKGDNFMNPQRRSKPAEDSSQPNKENRPFKSVYEHDSSKNDLSACGSMMVSPTFQSAHVVSLKDDLFRQEHPKYLSIGFALNDIDPRPIDLSGQERQQQEGQQGEQKYAQLVREMDNLKGRLAEHYQSKRYWKKIEKLFEQEDVDAVLAWQDSIDKYQTVKNEATKQ
jgi:hypothetical protein